MDFEVGGGLPRRRPLPPPSTGEFQGCLVVVGIILLFLIIICCAL